MFHAQGTYIPASTYTLLHAQHTLKVAYIKRASWRVDRKIDE